MQVVGKSELVSGTYEGRKWSHRKLYCVYSDPSQKGVQGQIAECFKIAEGVSDLSNVGVGRNIDVEFNKFGRISAVKPLV